MSEVSDLDFFRIFKFWKTTQWYYLMFAISEAKQRHVLRDQSRQKNNFPIMNKSLRLTSLTIPYHLYNAIILNL